MPKSRSMTHRHQNRESLRFKPSSSLSYSSLALVRYFCESVTKLAGQLVSGRVRFHGLAVVAELNPPIATTIAMTTAQVARLAAADPAGRILAALAVANSAAAEPGEAGDYLTSVGAHERIW